MKVEEFVKKYNMASKVKGNELNFLQERMTRDYVPFVQKVALCNNLVSVCWYVDDDRTQSKRLFIKSPNLYLFYVMRLIRLYTDIQFEDTKIAEAYDCLNKYRINDEITLVQAIINGIPATERAEFNSILEMVESDTEKNEHEISSWLSNKIDNVATIMGSSVIPLLESAGISIEDIKNIITNLNS